MNLSRIRRSFLWSFIGFLSLSALVAIFSVLSGEFGSAQLKVLVTTFTISSASICAMSCAAFIEKRGNNFFGFIGALAAGISAILTIAGVWGEITATEYWKTTVVLIVVSVSSAYALLLLIPKLAPSHRWTQIVAATFIGTLALQIIFAVCLQIDNEWYYRLLAVTSIVAVLMTLVIPICLKLPGKEGQESSDHLVLEKISADIYVDQTGRKLRVTPIESGQSAEHS